jgi:signal transduction histidine kinase
MRQVLALGGVTVAALAGLAAFYATGRAVQPVRDVASLAREIERTADFTRRLPEAPSSREMQEMARTFNRMVERVERLVQTQRSFLSDTSHELRRPLTILRTNLDVINEAALTAEERGAVRREMCEVVDSMSLLLSELLLLARQDEESLQLKPTDLTAVCTQAMKAVSLSHPGHTYHCELEAAVIVLADRERLYRAVSNLLQNAATYTTRPGEVALNLRSEHGWARLTVNDSGSGMTPEDVEHAFDRFYRGVGARRARPDGLGLGLAIVKQVVDSHEATIEIHSMPGHGTRVEVQIPLIDS